MDRAVEGVKRSLAANSDRLSRFGYRMSLFLQKTGSSRHMFSEQDHSGWAKGVFHDEDSD